MHFLSVIVAVLTGLSAAAAAPSKRTVAGSILAPVAEQSISTGAVIPFTYADSNWCHEGYTPITIYLSDSAPTTLNATGGLPTGTYITSFGPYLIPNFGLRPYEDLRWLKSRSVRGL
ncbi:hypothetical protein DFH08DRAFT_883097 [Mycena albidolilacea]|uniref:Uncharacterized protein n=1 Tax=Mycena albidolilacea TaxID=1033008 RepID=A0AAD6ZN46_9AGAR|nr:hypothetical protein DFH08DRAFT_883097 [Mycena albidolilacea]